MKTTLTRPKDMTLRQLEALPAMSDLEAGFGEGVRGDDIIWFTDRKGRTWRLQLGEKGWYRSTGMFPSCLKKKVRSA